mgnify:FL=1
MSIMEYMNTSSCGFKFIEYIVNYDSTEIITTEQLKNVLINFYLNANYPNELIPYGRGSDDNNWSFFSLIQWYSFQGTYTEIIHSQPMNKKNTIISDIIMRESYMPTELDLLILLEHYNISAIVLSTNKGFVISPASFKTNIGNEENKFMILMNVTKDKDAKVPRKKLNSTISFGLLKYNNNDKINMQNLKNSLLPKTNVNQFISAFIDSRLKLQNKTKESKKKRQIKKLGKKKLGKK